MNKSLQIFARNEIKKGLAQLPEVNQVMFKRMYSHTDLDKAINQVVDDMPEDKLNLALTQVEQTINDRRAATHGSALL